jgi:hypothetical protein
VSLAVVRVNPEASVVHALSISAVGCLVYLYLCRGVPCLSLSQPWGFILLGFGFLFWFQLP